MADHQEDLYAFDVQQYTSCQENLKRAQGFWVAEDNKVNIMVIREVFFPNGKVDLILLKWPYKAYNMANGKNYEYDFNRTFNASYCKRF